MSWNASIFGRNSPLSPDSEPAPLFYRPEHPIIYNNLPHLRPSVFYIFGGTSLLSLPKSRIAKVEMTGIGIGGSGCAPAGRVKQAVFEKIGHLIPMEAPVETAERCAEWLEQEVQRVNAEDEAFYAEWDRIPLEKKVTVSDQWKKDTMLENEIVEVKAGKIRSTPSKL
jgi:hypothetical protein